MAHSQSIPTFDGIAWFSNDDGSCTVEVEVPSVSPILQEIHFDRYDGSTIIHHGYGNRQWIATGVLIFDTQASMNQRLRDLELFLDDLFYVDDHWHVLFDSSGNTFTETKITSVTKIRAHAHGYADGWLCEIAIQGIINGSPVDGS